MPSCSLGRIFFPWYTAWGKTILETSIDFPAPGVTFINIFLLMPRFFVSFLINGARFCLLCLHVLIKHKWVGGIKGALLVGVFGVFIYGMCLKGKQDCWLSYKLLNFRIHRKEAIP